MPECVFCRIVERTAPARVVAEYPGAVAFLPLRPAVLGHTLVIPTEHVPSLTDLDPQVAYALTDATLDVARRITRVLRPDGLNVVQSNGAAASQTVFHVHVHVVPRTADDHLPALWPPSTSWGPEMLDETAARLRAADDHGSPQSGEHRITDRHDRQQDGDR